MPLTKFTADTAVIAALADLPNATSGLTPAQLKAEFDKSPTALKAYINDVLTPEIDESFVTNTNLTANRKLSESGDFTGTLNGAPIVATDPGLSSIVAAHVGESVTDTDGAHGLTIKNGTFTPILAGVTIAGVNTYAIQVGYYTKIGKRLFFDIYITLSAKDAAMSGAINILGLPSLSANNTNRRAGVAIGFFASVDTDVTRPIIGGQIVPNSSVVSMTLSGDNTSSSSLNATQITATSAFIISGNYETN